MANFLDYAPQVFSPSENPSETDIQLVMVVVQMIKLLYGALFKKLRGRVLSLDDQVFGSAVLELQAFVGYMAPHFPLGMNIINNDIKVRFNSLSQLLFPHTHLSQLEQAYQDMNIIFCELTSFLIPHMMSFPGRSRGKSRATSHQTINPSKPLGAIEHHVRYVRDYVVGLLKGEPPGAQTPRPISTSTYHALLPTLWTLLSNSSSANEESNSNDILRSIIQHAIRVSSTSAVKPSTLEFMSRLILVSAFDSIHSTY
jgi:pre-rRNA-processing protein IPI1